MSEEVDTIITNVEITVTTVRNATSSVETEKINLSNTTLSPTAMYNTPYLGRSVGERLVEELNTPLKNTISRQFGIACESGHEEPIEDPST